MAWEEIEDKIQALGFALFKDSKPDVGKTFEGVRMWQPRGFGGVILRTEYLSVDALRDSEFNYTDLTNKDKGLASSEWVGWKYKE
jgi:hypothetical protein